MESRQKKIHVMHVIGHPVGGVRKHVVTLLKHLPADIFVQSFVYSSLAYDEVFKSEVESLNNHVDVSISLPIKKSLDIRDLASIFRITRLAKNRNIDIIHGHGAKGGMLARVAAFLSGAKAVYTPHGGVVHDMFSPTSAYLYRTVERLLANFTDMFVFESHYTSEQFFLRIKSLNKNCYKVCYNGSFESLNISKEKTSKTLIEDELMVGVFGSLRHEKGQDLFLKALRQANDSGVKIFGHLFGSGPSEKYLKKLVLTLGLSSKVKFYGDVNDVASNMALMDVILIPSRHEFFGYVAIVAMELQKPIIATCVGGLVEVVGNTAGILVNPIADEISLALLEFMKYDSLQRAKFGHAGKLRYLTMFSGDRMISNLTEIYLNLINIKENIQ